jgi:peptidoglycan-associated lipoprotein
MRTIYLVVTTLAMALPLLAEELPINRGESTSSVSQSTPVPNQEPFGQARTFLFGGVSYSKSTEIAGGDHWLGFHGQAAVHLTDWIAIAGDVSYHAGSAIGIFHSIESRYSHFTGGPQFGNRTGRLRGFGHALFGGARIKVSAAGRPASVSETGFATTIGGGLDVALTKHLAIRAIEGDWLRMWGDNGGNLARFSVGVVGCF